MSQEVGRIISSNNRSARAEFTEQVIEGMLVAIKTRGQRYVAKIERLETSKVHGLTGYIYYLDQLERPPRTMTPITIAQEEFERGIFDVGTDVRGIKIRLPLNPIFGHLLVAGITTAGKTHLLVVFAEEFIKRKVPALIIDPQGEFVNLPEISDRVVVVEDLRWENLLSYMQARKIVVYNMLGFPKRTKISRVAELLPQIMEAKEKDYLQANSEPRLMKIPPILIMLDEADLFAPNYRKQMSAPREAVGPVMDLLNRGSKFGLGAIVATQRITRLELDVRSQCNSAAVFKLIDAGSLQAIHTIDYIPKKELQKITGLERGQCLIAGNIVRRARIAYIRDIVTKRAKQRDFEKILGVEPEDEEEHIARVIKTVDGDIVDKDTGDIIHEGIDRLIEEDKEAFEESEREDGVVFRTHISKEEEQILKKLRKPNEKGERLIG